MSYYQQLIEQINSALSYHDKRGYLQRFKAGFNQLANQGLLNQLFDVIGVSCLKDNSFFMEKLYWPIYKFIRNRLPDQVLFQMEDYVLQKYTLYPTEQIIVAFGGKIVQNSNQVKGRIYLTKFRIIGEGKWGPTPLSSIGMAAAMGGGNTGGGASSMNSPNYGAGLWINHAIQKAVKSQVQESMSKEFSIYDRACFGYQYPISGHYDLKVTRRTIKYKVDIQVQKRNRYKNKTLKMKILPYQNVKQVLPVLADTIDHAPLNF